ncbi:MAG: GNAT family N-acetyltransferase [Vicinamibacteraceae bacterium]
MTVRVRVTSDLDVATLSAIRGLLDAAFAGQFSDDDWAHALGGTHATVEIAGDIVAHASVVPRTLDLRPHRLRVGYVEAAAVRPDLQRTGLGSEVMRALADVIARDFALGALSTGEWLFYERLAWERWQGPTWVRYPDGRRERTPDDDASVMVLRTPGTPALDVSAPLTCEARAGDAW